VDFESLVPQVRISDLCTLDMLANVKGFAGHITVSRLAQRREPLQVVEVEHRTDVFIACLAELPSWKAMGNKWSR